MSRKQDLVTIKVPRELRDKLKIIASSNSRSMVAQLTVIIDRVLNDKGI